MAISTSPITVTVQLKTKARILQAAIKDDRSFSQMVNRLCEIGLQQYWGGFEPIITDPVQFLEVNKRVEPAE